ncbi:MAG: CDP-diacylglycerol--serine O-phosphatidyltransferase [Bdellovibrionales bacterium]|nr:CDP-diacylglycerol--serine O-phosphatidyltransferase [Bdellovibrionales bacterium]
MAQPELPAHHSQKVEDLRVLVRARRRGIYIYALPNLLTSANLLLGFLAILLAVDGRYIQAVWAVLFSSIFDMLDGRVARLTNTTSRFGVEYDSLCDLVSFGIAPSILIYFAALKPFGRAGMVAAFVFALCGALRLARFNVLADVVPKSYFMGLPIPIASLTLCTSLLFAEELRIDAYRNPWFLALTLSLGMLMVSTFKFPSFKDTHVRRRRAFSPFAFLFITLVILVSWFEVAAFSFFLIYIILSVSLHGVRSWQQWKKAKNA